MILLKQLLISSLVSETRSMRDIEDYISRGGFSREMAYGAMSNKSISDQDKDSLKKSIESFDTVGDFDWPNNSIRDKITKLAYSTHTPTPAEEYPTNHKNVGCGNKKLPNIGNGLSKSEVSLRMKDIERRLSGKA